MKSRIIIALLMIMSITALQAKPIKVLILSGHTDKWHYWPIKSEYFKAILQNTAIFETTEILLTEANKFDLTPNIDLSDYKAIILNINDVKWSQPSKSDFEKYVQNGGGLVIVHEADNAFPEWKAFNEMIGLGGWGKRDEKSGPYYYWKDGKYIYDNTPGVGGSHGNRVPYVINVRDQKHPITKGLPAKWLHQNDELYGNLRGPAQNIHVLATAYSTQETGGTGKEEPVLFTLRYGKGRIFHSVMGHTTPELNDAFQDVGFQVTFSRGTEWAATGKVKQKLPDEFPTETSVVLKNINELIK